MSSQRNYIEIRMWNYTEGTARCNGKGNELGSRKRMHGPGSMRTPRGKARKTPHEETYRITRREYFGKQKRTQRDITGNKGEHIAERTTKTTKDNIGNRREQGNNLKFSNVKTEWLTCTEEIPFVFIEAVI